ncbi:unnamed protein product [Urochloa humidicola]
MPGYASRSRAGETLRTAPKHSQGIHLIPLSPRYVDLRIMEKLASIAKVAVTARHHDDVFMQGCKLHDACPEIWIPVILLLQLCLFLKGQ